MDQGNLKKHRVLRKNQLTKEQNRSGKENLLVTISGKVVINVSELTYSFNWLNSN